MSPGASTRRAGKLFSDLRTVLPRLRTLQTWRLASGLVLFVFALTHFLNHALGHVSLEAMEQAQSMRRAVWGAPPGTLLLYGAVGVHVGLALWKLVNRHTWRMPLWEAAQIALGFSIPFLAVGHVITTRGLSAWFELEPTYSTHLRLLWPAKAVAQSLLLIIVWLHATVGLHHWLRIQRWYVACSPLFLVFAVLIPTLALTGWIEGARRVALMRFEAPPLSDALILARERLIVNAEAAIWAATFIVVGTMLITRVCGSIRRGPMIVYPGGRRVKAHAGATLLEISRAAGLPHASVCGGRGRCTTCRVLVLEGANHLHLPNPTEAAALERIKAPVGVRLACQIRPSHSITIRPLIPVRAPGSTTGDDEECWGVERRVTIMFADLRGFTGIVERLYPFDAGFLLNRYAEVMEQAVRRCGGAVDKFLGDGLMALFGIASEHGFGSADALRAAEAMRSALEELNVEFNSAIKQPLRIRIGIHTGPAVLGRVGAGPARQVTAIGDSVNVASRLEALNKEFDPVLNRFRGNGSLLGSRYPRRRVAGDRHAGPSGATSGLRLPCWRQRRR